MIETTEDRIQREKIRNGLQPVITTKSYDDIIEAGRKRLAESFYERLCQEHPEIKKIFDDFEIKITEDELIPTEKQ